MNGSIAAKFKKSIMFLFKILIVVTAVGLYIGGFKIWYEAPRLMFKDNYVVGMVYLLVFYTLSYSYGAYRIGILRLRELIYSFSLALIIANFTGYSQLSLMLHRFIAVGPMILLTCAQVLAGTLLYVAANAVYFAINPARDALAILANPEDDERVLRKFLSESKRYRIVQYCHESDGDAAVQSAMDGQPLVLMLGHGRPEFRSMVIRHCYETDKRLLMVPNVDEIFVHSAVRCQIDDIPAFLFRGHQMSSEQKLIKRAIDVAGSAAALIALSPLMLIAALSVRLHDGGPALYRQTRVTEGGRPFQLYKFRTMVQNAESNGAEMASNHDGRITPVGRWLRMLRIDELPQLFNILKGDMSLVGPRPERPELIEQYCRQYPEFRYRLKVKSGLTGYAQVFGRYNTLFEDKLKLDLLYIQHFSLIFDFYLMISTVKVLFMPSSSAGVEGKDPGGK
ncbi:sugar transferase [Pyramidobacter sp.]|uniref:sugar transferase n=1 Tax=Pyramidobacter sp. TaxID=1943581 RepID=UPI0025F5B76B|nr:sugar transferase [Pyramidobacter sp.]MCI7404181.1 sugar transferase [Pyramidobacter sp.]MDY3212806.1 sugar transferase [Pyramidobacter sp.]